MIAMPLEREERANLQQKSSLSVVLEQRGMKQGLEEEMVHAARVSPLLPSARSSHPRRRVKVAGESKIILP
jgi:hypothetical protein